jgi:hypothetical protein
MVDATKRLSHLLALLLVASTVGIACGGADTEEEEYLNNLSLGLQKDEEGNLFQSRDLDRDGTVDVRVFYEELPDEEDPSITTMRKLRKEVDVNDDGKVNLVRHYNDLEKVMREEIDTDLDGRFDAINHIDDGEILRKDVLDPESGNVIASRYYEDGQILRVEKDLSGDSKIDYWEYYERGVLDRIGRDLNADGRADSWQTR